MVSDFSFFTRSILPIYFLSINTWAKSWNSPLSTLCEGISGRRVEYIIVPQPISISSKVLGAPFTGLVMAAMKGANSVSSNLGTVMMDIGALGTAGIFLPSLYFSIILRSSQNFGVA